MYPQQNAERHNTSRYEIVQLKSPIPVIRRGQSFNVAIRFEGREFVDKDNLKVIFSLGNSPNTLKGTKGVIFVSDDKNLELDDSKWGGKIVRNEEKTVTLEVTICKRSF